MKTILEVLKLSSEFLAERKIDRPRRIAEELLAHALRLKRMDLYLLFDKPIEEKELALIRELLKRCAKQEPLEYVLGEIDFFGAQIKVDRRALIPRQETEILVERVSKKLRGKVLWDICTGTGCIGISLKKKHPELDVTLSDISQEALELASMNAKLNSVDVLLLQGDLLAPFVGQKADIIICNPPYISQKEFEALDMSVRGFEPKLALLGGERGSEIYEKLSTVLPQYLNDGAQVFFEIGKDQGPILKALFPDGELFMDWSGHPRFFEISF
jgi:release factor glutamine methyltransferase